MTAEKNVLALSDQAQPQIIYTFDTSALNRIFSSDELFAQLLAILSKAQIKVHIPAGVLNELAGGDSVKTATRVKLLKKVLGEPMCEAKLLFTAPLEKWIKVEIRQKGILNYAPMMSVPERNAVLDALTNEEHYSIILEESELERIESKQSSLELLDLTKSLRANSKVSLNQKELREVLTSYSNYYRVRDIGFWAEKLTPKKSLSNVRIKKIMRSKFRYRISRTFVSLMHMRGLGNALSRYVQNDPLQFFSKIKPNDFVDTLILITAASSNFFVTEDGGQRDFANFARSRGIVSCTSIDVDDFFKQFP